MARFKLLPEGVRRDDGACIPPDDGNADWRDYQAWLAAGNTPDPAEQPAPSEKRRKVDRALIVDRLILAGRLQACRDLLDAAPLELRERWNARTAIFADDEGARALLKRAGADPDEILAP